MEKVDILVPPTFKKSGKIKTLVQAWNDEDWIGTFNLWIVQNDPEKAIIYQQRSPRSAWAPGKLDVTAGGHYEAGETIKDGLREVEEELGKKFKFDQLKYLGRKMHVSPDEAGRERHNIVDIFIVKDNQNIKEFKLEEKEVYAICVCPISELNMVHKNKKHTFKAKGFRYDGKQVIIKVSAESFPYNWDNYHFKVTLLAKRYLDGEKDLIY